MQDGNRPRVCSDSWVPSQPWEWDLLSGDPRGPGSACSLSWYTPILALRPGKRLSLTVVSPGLVLNFLL